MQVHGVFADEAAEHWPVIERHIAGALAVVDTGYSLDDLLAAVQVRDKQLWVIGDGIAAGITSILVLPRWKKLVVEYLGGERMAVWLDAWFEAMQQFAQMNDCKYIEAQGRVGWAGISRRRGDDVVTYSVSRKRV